jgi:tRNA-specific 2-thiouridylase
MPQKRGDVLLEKNEVIGHHNGALFLTIGERHGFTITKKSDKEVPLYVVSKNIEKNTITVVPMLRSISKFRPLHPIAWDPHGPKFVDTASQKVIINNLNFISEIKKKNLMCRIRYRQEKISCRIEKDKVIFDKPQMGVSPGQSLVLYDGETCLGGGIIDSTG